MQAPRTALISEPGLKSRLPWSNTRRMALCGECGRSEEAQRRCNTMLSLRRSQTLLLAGQLSIERRCAQGNWVYSHTWARRCARRQETSAQTNKPELRHHVMPTSRNDSRVCTRTSFDVVSSARRTALSKTGEVTCASQRRSTEKLMSDGGTGNAWFRQ